MTRIALGVVVALAAGCEDRERRLGRGTMSFAEASAKIKRLGGRVVKKEGTPIPVFAIDFSERPISDTDLAVLAEFPAVWRIDLSSTHIKGDALVQVAKCP